MKKLAFGLLLALHGACYASELPDSTRQEISHLFSYLEASGCQFSRNGSWHDANEAVDHLKKKYQYLLKKDMISSTEDFIANAASKSSVSGNAYLVKCADAAPVESGAWFLAELQTFRKSAQKAQVTR